MNISLLVNLLNGSLIKHSLIKDIKSEKQRAGLTARGDILQ